MSGHGRDETENGTSAGSGEQLRAKTARRAFTPARSLFHRRGDAG
jgi:hypothetical protein